MNDYKNFMAWFLKVKKINKYKIQEKYKERKQREKVEK